MRREGSMVGGDREIDDFHVPVMRLSPSLRSALGREPSLDTENDFTRKLPGQRFEKCFLMRAGNRLPEDDARDGTQRSLDGVRGQRISGPTRPGTP